MVEFGKFTPASNEVLHATTTSLVNLQYENLRTLVNNRLIGNPSDTLRPLDYKISEDPTDVFIEFIDEHGHNPMIQPFIARMQEICTEFTLEASLQPDETLTRNTEAVGELLFMSARIGARKTIPHIATLAGRKSLSQVILTTGEDLQNRALRSLGGLLSDEEPETKTKYRKLFEEALENKAHLTTGLATLIAFFPEDRERYISIARKEGVPNLNQLLKLWEDS